MKTREKLTDRMTGVSPEQVAGAVAAAQGAWDNDWQCWIYTASALSGLESEGLSAAVDGILRIGWTLHSTALGNRTVGPNAQQAMFVFTRPLALP